MINLEEKINEKFKYKKGPIGVQIDEIRTKSGKTEERIWIDFPSVCVIVPFISKTEVLLVRQYRYAIQSITYELPAGKVDPDEIIVDAARRELIEETGYQASIEEIFRLCPSPHYSNELLHICIGKNLEKLERVIDQDEIVEVKKMPLTLALEMIDNGAIIDGKSIMALLYLKHKNIIDDYSLLVI